MSIRFLRAILGASAAVLCLVPMAMSVAAQDLSDVPANATRLLTVVTTVDNAVSAGDWATARGGWNDFDNLWEEVEDGFRAISRDNYRTIETHQGTIRGLLREDSPDADRIRSEITSIRELIQWFGPN